MEKRIPVTNNGAMMLYVGANMVPPGETRDFPESQVPHHLRPAPVEVKEETPADPLASLLDGNVPSVVAALPELSVEQLEKLGEMEQAGGKRKGVLNALAEALLTRAANKDALDKIVLLSDEELAAALKEAGTDINAAPEYIAALKAELAKRLAE
ncbi:MAG: hypothetical protein B7Y56_03455 [Gallionellales bacterium 35-53-114]|nr:MAG: hypothetical protein B7Y56_03455 [Gallionellales bacterium 35-53-114]OYZ65162.1 MAG: hypothetical protein B7Y04_00615 [Gallionellales bacterium 24-53-125]OZB08070.1 MAG: hypothetical protein B7X61_11065 [Gallionellales bacterium 39-52-133]HQS59974.1 hypothetical protein [Gallionellaceae bacterium]HQS76644.1 hypothetical protein [Gallionellaceae bacterium]